jgi:hypothetical protein
MVVVPRYTNFIHEGKGAAETELKFNKPDTDQPYKKSLPGASVIKRFTAISYEFS